MKQLEIQFVSESTILEQQELDELYKPDPDEPWWNR